MTEKGKVVQGLRDIKTYLECQALEASVHGNDLAREGFIESQGIIRDAITLLKEEKEANNMPFRQAFYEMLNGKRIAHELWKGGYWAWENNTIMIHCYDGKVLDIRETENTAYTFGFIVEDRWYVKE